MALCSITGNLKLPSGAAAAYAKLRLVRASLTGTVIIKDPEDYTATSGGVVTFTATQGSTIYVYCLASGLDTNGPRGVALSVPASSTANLEDLVSVTTDQVGTITASRAAVSNAAGTITASATTAAQIAGLGTITAGNLPYVATGGVFAPTSGPGGTISATGAIVVPSAGFAGSSSGTVTVQGAAAAGTWTLTLPTSGGTSGYVLQTNGSGVTTWAAASGVSGLTAGRLPYAASSTTLADSANATLDANGALFVKYITLQSSASGLNPIFDINSSAGAAKWEGLLGASNELIFHDFVNNKNVLTLFPGSTPTIDLVGTLRFASDDTYDIGGTSSTLRPRTVYAATSVNSPLLKAGVASSVTGSIQLNHASTAQNVTLRAGVTSAAYTFTFPLTAGTSGYFLQTDGSGTTTWAAGGGGLTIGTTAITSGTGGRLLYETTGNVVGEISTLTSDGTIVTFSPTVTTGTGTTSGLNANANSLTTGDAFNFASSSVSSGNVVKIAATGTAAASNTKTAFNVSTSGANATSTQTTYAAQFSNTSTGTSSTNIALGLTASGGTTNLALSVVSGNVKLPSTINSTLSGIIYKGSNLFCHDFTYGNNGTVTIDIGNVFLGESAGNLTMGSTATQTYHASRIVGIGYQALTAVTTGYNLTAIGWKAGKAVTTGNGNTLIGASAGTAITTGGSNFILGTNAGTVLVDGSDNVIIGTGAMQAAVSCGANIAIGSAALAAVTSTNVNIGIGYYALKILVGGSYNTAIGHYALQSAVSTSSCTAIGYYVLFNATGSYNGGYGQYSLYDVTSGAKNTAIGYNSGRGIQTGDSNTIIGANTTGLSSSLANNIVIADGDGVVRIQVNSSGNLTTMPGIADGVNLVLQTTTGTKIGTGTTQKLGFWNATPVVQQVLATGAGATVDNVITFLQTIGLCKQS